MRYFRALPKLNEFFLFLRCSFKNKVCKIEVKKSNNNISYLFSRSRYSLISLFKSVQKINNNSVILWIPEFFCWEIAKFLQVNNIDIKFYSLNDDLSPNCKFLNENILKFTDSTHLFLLVNFFGLDIDFNETKKLTLKNDVILIFDETHSLKIKRKLVNEKEFIISSPYKHLPISEGAILYTFFNQNGKSELNSLIEKSFKINNLNYEFLNLYFNDLFWFLKSFIVKFFKIFKTSINTKSQHNFELGKTTSKKIYQGLSCYNHEIIKKNINSKNNFIKSDFVYYNNILNIISSHYDCYGLNNLSNNSHLFGINFTSQKDLIKVFKLIESLKIPVILWPDFVYSNLFKELELNPNTKEICHNTLYLIALESNNSETILSKNKIIHKLKNLISNDN